MTKYEQDGVHYFVYDDQYVIVGNLSKYLVNFLNPTATNNSYSLANELIIPETFHDHPIVGFANSSFSRCISLKKVVIQANIETLPYRCFADCNNLIYLEIPASVKKIEVESIHFYNISSTPAQSHTHPYVIFKSGSQLEFIDEINFAYADAITIIFESRVQIEAKSQLYSYTNKVYLLCNKPMKLGNLQSVTFDPCSIHCQYSKILDMIFIISIQVFISL